MKKILSFIMALTLVMSMNLTVFAAEGTGQLTDENKAQTIDVTAGYFDSIETPNVYSVDISWEDMTYTWNVSGTKTWDPATHTYSTSNGGSTISGGSKRWITVTNHSNVDITAKFSLAYEADWLLKFADDNSAYGSSYTMNLDAGVENDPTNADNGTIAVRLDRWPSTIEDGAKIGTVTITIE